MLRKVIMCIESPFNKRDYKRFGIEMLKSNGFDPQVWDMSRIFHPELDLTPRDPFEFPGLRIFMDKSAVVDSIKELAALDMIITWFDYTYFRFFWLYRAISKANAPYSVLQVRSPVTFFGVNESLYAKIKRVFARRPPKASFRYIRDKFFRRIPYKLLGVKPAKFWFTGTDASIPCYFFPVNSSTRKTFLHVFDYDLYLESNRGEMKFPANAVFLDSYLPFHEDDAMDGLLHWVSAQNYYPSLCGFFDYVEKEQDVKVDIAAHPRSFYEKHPEYFAGRTRRMGQTIESVRDAKFIIAHDSEALNFAVLFYKPILFIITDEMIRNNVTSTTLKIASWFKKAPINIDKPLSIDWEGELKVDKGDYDRFKNNFIKKTGTKDDYLWQIIADTWNGR